MDNMDYMVTDGRLWEQAKDLYERNFRQKVQQAEHTIKDRVADVHNKAQEAKEKITEELVAAQTHFKGLKNKWLSDDDTKARA